MKNRYPWFIIGCTLWLGLCSFAEEPAWEEHVRETLASIQQELGRHPAILHALEEANEKHRRLHHKTIVSRDRKWQETQGVDPFITGLLVNGAARELKRFQKKHRTLVEIFLTDRRGIIIAATNKTSDYYQADEAWWQETIKLRPGSTSQGAWEYDQSALTNAIPLFVAVGDTENRQAAGVLKAVCSHEKFLRTGVS